MKNLNSSNKNFGIVFGIFFIIIFFYNYLNNNHFSFNILLVSLTFFIFAYLYPKIFTPLNNVWINIGNLLGKFIAPVVMFFIYFTIVFVTSIFLKTINKDILNLKVNKNSKTFWKARDKKIGDMNKQF